MAGRLVTVAPQPDEEQVGDVDHAVGIHIGFEVGTNGSHLIADSGDVCGVDDAVNRQEREAPGHVLYYRTQADHRRADAHTGAKSGDSAAIAARPLDDPPMGPFGYSMIATEDGEPLDVEDFAFYDDCEECHERQWEELEGSMHVISHTDPLYRNTAKLALLEAGEEIYAYCSGCHAPQGVTTGLIPGETCSPPTSQPDFFVVFDTS